MKRSMAILALAVVTTAAAWAAPAGLHDAQVSDLTALDDPARADEPAAGEWLAFRIPARPGTSSICCWKGNWESQREVGCSLERAHQSYGSTSESPDAEHFLVFARGGETGIDRLMVVGGQCPVQGGGKQVDWLGDVSDEAALNWLRSQVDDSDQDSVRHGALQAIALHDGSEAEALLYGLATERNSGVSEEALFWLMEAHGEAGAERLFGLAGDPAQPREIRRQALFWLAHSGDEAVVDELVELLTR